MKATLSLGFANTGAPAKGGFVTFWLDHGQFAFKVLVLDIRGICARMFGHLRTMLLLQVVFLWHLQV